MNKKIKAILVVIYFVSAIVISLICCLYFEDLIALSLINGFCSLIPIIDDEELQNMNLW